MTYKHLNQSFWINKMELRNRMAFPPMNTNFCNEFGGVTDLMIDYYARRAKGGAALITVEATTVDLRSINHAAQPHLTNRAVIPGWSRLVDKVHRNGAKISIELNHWGADGSVNTGVPEVSSSDVTSRGPGYLIQPLSLKEIKELQEAHVRSVIYAKDAGFDAITFHAAHGNIMPQFFSTMFNKRTDWYGGSLQNRVRFAEEIIQMTRAAVGPDFPIIMRISADEYMSEGRKLEETIEICKILEQAGVDAFDVSGGIQATYLFSIAPYNFPGLEGFMIKNAKAIKAAVNVPVIGVGGIRTPEYAEKLLAEGYADMIAFGRSGIADPDFFKKSLADKAETIRPCISCNHCLKTMDSDKFLTCNVNPEAGREHDYWQIEPAREKKKVLVAGGGPGGMEAARVAALRGHQATLVEKTGKLGGSMYAAGLPPHKDSLLALIKWYENELRSLGVDVRLNTAFEDINPAGYDKVLLATGANYLRVIPGSDKNHVMTAIEALEHPEKVGQKVVIIGGGSSAVETAEYFGARAVDFSIEEMVDFSQELKCKTWTVAGEKNKDVTVVEMLPEVCSDMQDFARTVLMKKLDINGVKVMCKTKVSRIDDSKVIVVDGVKNQILALEADTVILAGGLKPNRLAADQYNVTYIGDAVRPGKIALAVTDGYCAAMDI